MVREIKVDNCHDCPFVRKNRHADKCYQICCTHADTLIDGLVFTLMAYHIEGDDTTIKHVLFDKCPLKTNSYLISLS